MITKKAIFATFIAALLLQIPAQLRSESVAEKASAKRAELLQYMRLLRPLAYNFPCDPFPVCVAKLTKADPGNRILLYRDAKRLYQEGMVFFFEGNYLNAYNRFLDSQKRTELILENLSQLMIDRATEMLLVSIQRKDLNDPRDASVIDISVDFAPKSKVMRDYKKTRDAAYEDRRYDPRQYHYMKNRYTIERNVEYGYRHLGQAKEARVKALNVDKYLRPNERMDPNLIKKRIELYYVSINLSRKAKFNAERIFILKYPYDNYALTNPFGGKTEKIAGGKPPETPVIDGVRMDWSQNPNIEPYNLEPIFDLRFPEEFRRDAVDARNARFDDEKDVNLSLKFSKTKPKIEYLYDKEGRTEGGPGSRP